MRSEKRILTVSELTSQIKGMLESDPILNNVTVTGEISNYKVYPSGHHYFSLKDAESSVRCVMFRSSAQRMRFRPENGMSVAASGRIAVYPRDGAYQLYCTTLLPTGVGDLYAAFEQLKSRLSQEGLFDPAQKRALPYYPERIAVITSSAGAAVRDILRILKARWPISEVRLIPVRVQGAEAPAEIADAIRFANNHQLADLIITGRGGGSMEDLWAFNDERVARAIYASVIPVISAVGHEPDVTISDFVADLRAATPSNAAELAVPDQIEIRGILSDRQNRLYRAVTNRLHQEQTLLDAYAKRRVLADPAGYVSYKRMELDQTQKNLLRSYKTILTGARQTLGAKAASLDAMSPLKVLARGYAVASDAEGHILRSVENTEPGASIDVRLSDGTLSCLVQTKENNHGR